MFWNIYFRLTMIFSVKSYTEASPSIPGGHISVLRCLNCPFLVRLCMLKMQRWDNLYLRMKYSSLNLCKTPLSDSIDHYQSTDLYISLEIYLDPPRSSMESFSTDYYILGGK